MLFSIVALKNLWLKIFGWLCVYRLAFDEKMVRHTSRNYFASAMFNMSLKETQYGPNQTEQILQVAKRSVVLHFLLEPCCMFCCYK